MKQIRSTHVFAIIFALIGVGIGLYMMQFEDAPWYFIWTKARQLVVVIGVYVAACVLERHVKEEEKRLASGRSS